jgi:bla regulator protein blaR1
MIAASTLANHLWQSTLFAVAAWLLTLVLRKNRAAVRYGVWFAASVKFLVPFSLLIDAGSQLGWRTAPVIAPAADFSIVVEQLSQPFTVPALPPRAGPAAAATRWASLDLLLCGIWFCGFAATVAVWWRIWRRLRSAVRSAAPLLDPGLPLPVPVPVMTSPRQIEPGVLGILRPVLLLPEGILGQLTPEQFRTILAHELCHVRRRDNLTAAIHMLVESIFWFHPLAWWIGARLVEERERACDEEVLRQGAEPQVYAESILRVCRFYLQSALPCVSGVTGSDLKKRIEAIVSRSLAPRLSSAGKLLLVVSAAAAIGVPILVGLFHAASAQAQSKEKLVFEVVSVKRVNPAAQAGGRMALAPGVLPGGGLRSTVPIFNLICWAYRVDGSQLSGGPNWIHTDRYAIEARPGDDSLEAGFSELDRTNRARERVKALLADRFNMTVRTETKESQVYVLTVAKGGHKMAPASPEATSGFGVSRGAGVITSAVGAPMTFLAVALTQVLGRPVQDETGLGGHRFQFKLEFKPESFEEKRALALSGEPVADDDPRPSILSAIKGQLGLELQSRKVPIPTVTIERIERPSEN